MTRTRRLQRGTGRFGEFARRRRRTLFLFFSILLPLVLFRRFLFFLLLALSLRDVFARRLVGGTRFQLWHVDLAQVHREVSWWGIVLHLSVFAFRVVELYYLRTLQLRLFVDHVLMQLPFFIHTCTKH